MGVVLSTSHIRSKLGETAIQVEKNGATRDEEPYNGFIARGTKTTEKASQTRSEIAARRGAGQRWPFDQNKQQMYQQMLGSGSGLSGLKL